MATLDPVQGLVDYILDIKPYHTKIIEVLVEYIHTDELDITITDSLFMKMDSIFPSPSFEADTVCLSGFGAEYDSEEGPFTQYPITQISSSENSFIIAGNHVSEFLIGSNITVNNTLQSNGTHYVVNVTLVGPDTKIYVLTNIVETGAVGTLTHKKVGYDESATSCGGGLEGTESVVLFSETLNFGWGWATLLWFQYQITAVSLVNNTFTVASNATSDLLAGVDFQVLGSPGNNGVYTVLSSVYNIGPNTTIIQVTQIIHNGTAGGFIESTDSLNPSLAFTDTISTEIDEIRYSGAYDCPFDIDGFDEQLLVNTFVITTANSLIGSWDSQFWDIGGFDEDLSTVVLLYDQTV